MSTRNRKSTAKIATFSIDREILESVRARATADRVSLSGFVETALRRALDAPTASDETESSTATARREPVEPDPSQARAILRAARDALERVDELIE